MGTRLYALSQGKDPSQVENNYTRKSISSETTLDRDICDIESVRNVLLSLAQRVGRDLRKKEWVCRIVSIKIKFSDFTQITRSKKNRILDLFFCCHFQWSPFPVRAGGIKEKNPAVGRGGFPFPGERCTHSDGVTLPARWTAKKQWESVDMAVDSIMEKFGSDMVKKASLANPTRKNLSKDRKRRKK